MKLATTAEAARRADFSRIRYAQVWEDADVLLEALSPGPQDVCVSVASAGDNVFSLLSRGPRRVIAVDLNPAQLACVMLREAAYRALDHGELLELIGSRPSARRLALYERCRSLMTGQARDFWDRHPRAIRGGAGAAGKFERYFAIFRRFVLPLVHCRRRVQELLESRSAAGRLEFYENRWNTRRWRALFHVFFSRRVMGALGRDPSFFRYVDGIVSSRILERTRHALVELDPSCNPYLQWVLTGRHVSALPHALREENFDAIRTNLGRLELRQESLERFTSDERGRGSAVAKWNLSDVFEYMSEESAGRLLERIAAASVPEARLAYWNMLAPRRRPERLSEVLRPLSELAERLHWRDKAFFYSAFVVEERTEAALRGAD